jgi:hypothetical protein
VDTLGGGRKALYHRGKYNVERQIKVLIKNLVFLFTVFPSGVSADMIQNSAVGNLSQKTE